MTHRPMLTRMALAGILGCLAIVTLRPAARLQAQRGEPPAPAASPRASAPIDLTGYWVSVVTEDWRFRMVTPPKGDYASVPLNAEGRRLADTWDPARDERDGNACRAYGAGGIMRLPTRLKVAWADDKTLR